MNYKCSVINNVMRMEITQKFINQETMRRVVETEYKLPKLDNCSLLSFRATFEDKVIDGIIKEKEESQRVYKDGKKQGDFVSYSDINKDEKSIKILLGNIPTDKEIMIELIFSQQLNCLFNNFFQIDLPLVTVDSTEKNEDEIVISIDLICTSQITFLQVSNGKHQINKIDENSYQIQVKGQDISDYKHRFTSIYSYEGMFDPQIIYGNSKIFSEDIVKSNLIPPDHSIMLNFVPNFNENVSKKLNKYTQQALIDKVNIQSSDFNVKINDEVIDYMSSSKFEYIFLFDRSGSMRGKPIEKAKQALILFLKSLPKDSYFNVVSFGREYQYLFDSSQMYNENTLSKSIEEINQFSANLGGTDIYKPLFSILTQNVINDFPKQVFLLTDGEVENKNKVISLIQDHSKNIRVHAIGFGNAQKTLIRDCAEAGNGNYEIISYNDNLQETVIKILQQSLTPYLKDFKIDYDKEIFSSIYPDLENYNFLHLDQMFTLHLFLKSQINPEDLTDEQKIINFSYYNTQKRERKEFSIRLDINDCFRYDKQLQECIFKLGKQLQLDYLLQKNESNESNLLHQAVNYQLLTTKTAIICQICQISDESKAELVSSKIKQISISFRKNISDKNQKEKHSYILSKQEEKNPIQQIKQESNDDILKVECYRKQLIEEIAQAKQDQISSKNQQNKQKKKEMQQGRKEQVLSIKKMVLSKLEEKMKMVALQKEETKQKEIEEERRRIEEEKRRQLKEEKEKQRNTQKLMGIQKKQQYLFQQVMENKQELMGANMQLIKDEPIRKMKIQRDIFRQIVQENSKQYQKDEDIFQIEEQGRLNNRNRQNIDRNKTEFGYIVEKNSKQQQKDEDILQLQSDDGLNNQKRLKKRRKQKQKDEDQHQFQQNDGLNNRNSQNRSNINLNKTEIDYQPLLNKSKMAFNNQDLQDSKNLNLKKNNLKYKQNKILNNEETREKITQFRQNNNNNCSNINYEQKKNDLKKAICFNHETQSNELDALLNSVNFEGIWEYSEQVIAKYIQQTQEFKELFNSYNKNILMTLIVLSILEIKFYQEKQKYILIYKKSMKQIEESIDESQIENLKYFFKKLVI